MAETNRLLNLTDWVTAPIKQFVSQIAKTKCAVNELNAINGFTQKETENALKEEKEN